MEPDGAPESLVGRIDPKQMGSRVLREAPKDLEKKKKAAADDVGERKRRPQDTAGGGGFQYTDIIDATQDIEGLVYRPRTRETREVYNLMVGIVHSALGDQANDIVRSAAETVLDTLKTDSLKDFDKKRDIEQIVGPLTGENFSQLVNLSKKITDYGAEDEEMVDPDIERKDAEIDDEFGVNVLFEDEDEQEEDDEEGFEIRDESDDEEGDEEDAQGEAGDEGEQDGADALVFGGGGGGKKKAKSDQDTVSPHEIDGFWLQRLVSTVYPDAVTSTAKTTEALDILSSEANLRDVENSLMDLFDYEHLQIVKTLTKNRDVIVWCTKLSRSDENERMSVEVAMWEKGVGWILKALAGDRTKPAAAASDAMEVDGKKAAAASAASGSILLSY